YVSGGGRHADNNATGFAALSFPFVAPERISLRVLPSESVNARLLGLIAAAGRNTRSFSSIHPAAVLWVPMQAASWPSRCPGSAVSDRPRAEADKRSLMMTQ